MTALFTEGFETVVETTDLLPRGLIQNALYNNGGATNGSTNSVAIASRTGYPGKGLFLRGPYNAGIQSPLGAANYCDFGMIPLNQSVHAMWQAGGFVVGFSASFNAQCFIEICPGGPMQLAYDGAQYYWAIYRNTSSSAFGVCYSTDLQNWTPCLSQPSFNQNSTITVNGSGPNAVVIVSNCSNYAVPSGSYLTTNMGLTWTTSGANGQYRTPIYLNGPTAYYVSMYCAGSTACYLAYGTSWAAAPVSVTAVTVLPTNTRTGGYTKQVGPYFVVAANTGINNYNLVAGATSAIAFCSSSADPTQAANWTVSGTLPYWFTDITYFNGYFIAVGFQGIYYMSPSNPSMWWPAQGISVGSGNGTTWGLFSVACNNGMVMAVGTDNVNPNLPAIYTSPDGINWTKQNRLTPTNNASTLMSSAYGCVIWDGQQWVVTGGWALGMIITSPNGFDWEVVYVPDYPESNASSLSFAGVYSGQMSSANVLTPWPVVNGANIAQDVSGFGVFPSALSSGARTVQPVVNYGTASSQGNFSLPGAAVNVSCPMPNLGQQPGSALTHYYELIFTAQTGGAANLFTLQWAIDGQVQPWSGGNLLLAANNDSGQMQLFFNLPRSGVFTVFDDIYMTSMDGLGNTGRLGPQSVFAVDPATVVQGQFSKTNASLTNAQVVNQELSNSQDYVYTSAASKEDIYGTTNLVPANYRVKAVQVDAMMTSFGMGTGPVGNVGVVSGSTPQTGASISPAAAGIENRATLFMENDPATGVAFTNAALNALELTITRTT